MCVCVCNITQIGVMVRASTSSFDANDTALSVLKTVMLLLDHGTWRLCTGADPTSKLRAKALAVVCAGCKQHVVASGVVSSIATTLKGLLCRQVALNIGPTTEQVPQEDWM